MLYGGVSRLYAIRFEDLNEIFNSGLVYSVNEAGEIDFINLKANKNFVEIGLLKNTTTLTEQLTNNKTNGNLFFTQRITVSLSHLNVENRNWIENALNQKVSIVVRTTSGFHAAGLYDGLNITEMTRTTGTNPNDFTGATITFSGLDRKMFYNVQPGVMIPSEYFNYYLEITPGNTTILESEFNFDEP